MSPAQARRTGGNPPPISQQRFTKVKTAIETVNNSSTLQNDDHFQFTLPGGSEVWAMEARLLVVGVSINADLKVGFTMTNSGTYEFGRGAAGTVAVGGSPSLLSTGNFSCGADNGRFVVQIVGWFYTSTDASAVKFQWSQSAATAENLSLDKGSFMDLRRVL